MIKTKRKKSMASGKELTRQVDDIRNTLYGNGQKGVCYRLAAIEINLKWQLKGTGIVIVLLVTMIITYFFKVVAS